MHGARSYFVLVLLSFVVGGTTTYADTQPSFCLSTADCCSFSSAAATRTLPCCGSIRSGPDAVRCGGDRRCYRGAAPCKSSVDDPLCNIPHATAGDATISLDQALDQWRACRSRDAAKMQALRALDLYGGGELVVEAASQARADAIEALLEESGSAFHAANSRGAGGATALHAAAAAGTDAGVESTAALQVLLANGADPNVLDAFGFTPLHRAIQANSAESATLLLSSGANVTISTPGRESPLHLAAYENARELAQLLLAFGADPFARNDRGVASFEVGLFDLSLPPHHMT